MLVSGRHDSHDEARQTVRQQQQRAELEQQACVARRQKGQAVRDEERGCREWKAGIGDSRIRAGYEAMRVTARP